MGRRLHRDYSGLRSSWGQIAEEKQSMKDLPSLGFCFCCSPLQQHLQTAAAQMSKQGEPGFSLPPSYPAKKATVVQ